MIINKLIYEDIISEITEAEDAKRNQVKASYLLDLERLTKTYQSQLVTSQSQVQDLAARANSLDS